MVEIYLKDLAKKTLEWRKSGYSPGSEDWPDNIYLEDYIVKELKYLEDYTKDRTFGAGITRGSTGWEYSETIVYLAGKLFFSKPKTGDYNSVVPELKITKPELKMVDTKVNVKFNIGEKQIDASFNRDEIQSDPNFGPVFIVHTHPKSKVTDKDNIYTFFSVPDLKFLKSSPVFMLGMISKNTLWLVCETNRFNSINPTILHGATLAELTGGDEAIKKYVSENMEDSGLIFYHGTFGSKLRRIYYEKKLPVDGTIKKQIPDFSELEAPKLKEREPDEYLGNVRSKKDRKLLLQTVFITVIIVLMIVSLIIILRIIGLI